MPSRRALLAGVAGVAGLSAGCLDTGDSPARCSSHGEGSGTQHLRQVAPITGDETVALGIVVSEAAVSNERFDAVDVRNVDGDLMARIPLATNRGMSGLDAENHPVLRSETGEVYAVTLGDPPVHGEVVVSLVDPEGDPITSADLRFNCYSSDGTLP
jgi:hypothetical protein